MIWMCIPHEHILHLQSLMTIKARKLQKLLYISRPYSHRITTVSHGNTTTTPFRPSAHTVDLLKGDELNIKGDELNIKGVRPYTGVL